MEALGRLIGELRAGGELDSRGGFTLDRDRAREKMRQFQLTDPRSYVLELVQAAVLAGASEAHFEIDADDLRMSFDGRPFTAEDFEQLYSSMFTRRSSLARRQLVLGLNSAMALAPKVLRVESGTARMEMRSDVDEITAEEDAVDGTRIHVKDRFGHATLVRFVLKFGGQITEMLHLKKRCRYAALAIYLGGERISRFEPLAEAVGRIERSTPGASIVAGFAREYRPARLMILDQGVWIATHQLDHLPHRFVACVESPRLIKDASQRDVVRDEAYDGVLAAVSAAFYQALAKLAAEPPSEDQLFRWLLLHPATLPLIRRVIAALQGSEADLLAADGDETPEGQTVTAVPLWPSARRPHLDLSLLDLLQLRASRGWVGWSQNAYPDLRRQNQPPVAVVSVDWERDYLTELFGDGFYCADPELQHELARWRNVLGWRQRHMEPEIPASAGPLISIPLATQEMKGEVGIFLDPFRQSEGQGKFPVWWIKDGRLLQRAIVTPIVRGFTAALEADFEPTENFARIEVDRLFVRVAVAIARALGPLMNRLAAESRQLPGLPELIRSCLISYLSIDWNGDGLAEHLKGFGITDEEHLSYAHRLVEKNPVEMLSTADLAGEEAPAIACLPLFDTILGLPPISIGLDPGRRLALRDIARGGKTWRYMPKPHSGPRSSAEHNVLLLDDGEIAVLRQVFPGVTLQDYSRTYHYPTAFARHMWQRPPVPHPDCIEEIAVEAGDVRGRFGLLYPRSPGKPVFAQLQLLKHDRRLADIRFRLPIGPIAGMINDDQLTPTPDWSDVEHDSRVESIRSLALERITGLLVDLCDSYRGPDGRVPEVHRRQLLLNAATRVLATEAALEDWSVSDLFPPEVTEQDWATALADALETVPLFANLDDRSVDLREIRHDLDRHDTLLYLPEHRGALGDWCEIQPQARARDFSSDQGAKPQAYGRISRISQHRAGGKDPRSARPEFHTRLLAAVGDTSPQEVLELAGGRPVLRLSRDDHDALARIFGSYRLSDARYWILTGRWGRELAADPGDRVRHSAEGEVLVEVALTGYGLGGEVAPPRELDEPGLEIAPDPGGRDRTSSRTASPHTLVAVVDDDRLEHSQQQPLAPAQPEGPTDAAPTAREEPVRDGSQPGEARLLRALHAELRLASHGHVQLLDEKNLDRIFLGDLTDDAIASCQAGGVTVNRRQPLVEKLLAELETDPVQMAFLASAVYTAMNHFWQEIEDDHEREFHRALIEGLLDERPWSDDARA